MSSLELGGKDLVETELWCQINVNLNSDWLFFPVLGVLTR